MFEKRRELALEVNVDLRERALSRVSGTLRAAKVNGVAVWGSFIDRCSHVLVAYFRETKDAFLSNIYRKCKKCSTDLRPRHVGLEVKMGAWRMPMRKTAEIKL